LRCELKLLGLGSPSAPESGFVSEVDWERVVVRSCSQALDEPSMTGYYVRLPETGRITLFDNWIER
jgi:hypothetical protein